MKISYFKPNFLCKPQDVPLITNPRRNKWHGSMGLPNALVKSYHIFNFHFIYGRPLAKDIPKQVTGYAWDTEIEWLIPSIFNSNTPIGRTSNLAAWGASYNELWRVALAQKAYWDDPLYKKVRDVITSYKTQILEAKLEYDKRILQKAGNFERFKQYVNHPRHRDSGVPGEPGKKWGDLTDSELAVKHKEIDSYLKYRVEHPKDLYDHGYIITPENKVEALRYRDALIEDGIRWTNNGIIAKHEAVRMRTATGVTYDSQEGYVFWGNPTDKTYCLEPFDKLIHTIGKAQIVTFDELKTQLYLDISKAENVTYADLKSGETQWGSNLGPFIPCASSVSDPETEPILYKGDSGVTLTPKYNALLSAANVQIFIDEGLIESTDKVGIGSDNIVFFKDINEAFTKSPNKQIAGVSLAERFYGWRGKSHYPYNAIRDNARTNVTWDGRPEYKINLKTVRINDIMQVILMYDFFHTGTAVKLYERFPGMYEQDYASEEEREDYFETNSTKIRDVFKEEFSQVEKLIAQTQIPVDNNISSSTFSFEPVGEKLMVGDLKTPMSYV